MSWRAPKCAGAVRSSRCALFGAVVQDCSGLCAKARMSGKYIEMRCMESAPGITIAEIEWWAWLVACVSLSLYFSAWHVAGMRALPSNLSIIIS